MKVIHVLDKILGKISDLCSWVSGAALFFIAALTFVDVFCRYFLRKSITGSQEICQLLMVFVVYFALSYSTRIRAHVRVDVLTNALPEWIRYIILGLVTIACIFVSINISIRTWKYAGSAYSGNISTVVLSLPHYPFYYIISVMSALLSLEFLADGLKYFGEAKAAFRSRKNSSVNKMDNKTEVSEGGDY